MDEDTKTYHCSECDQTIVIDQKDEIPVCCNRKMHALGACTAVHPEMARNTEDDEPCDDGRGQKL